MQLDVQLNAVRVGAENIFCNFQVAIRISPSRVICRQPLKQVANLLSAQVNSAPSTLCEIGNKW